jgi:hypothetical protein
LGKIAFTIQLIVNLGDKHHSLHPYFSDGCTIPDILQSANWDYDFDSTTATLYFTSSGMTGLSFTARGFRDFFDFLIFFVVGSSIPSINVWHTISQHYLGKKLRQSKPN